MSPKSKKQSKPLKKGKAATPVRQQSNPMSSITVNAFQAPETENDFLEEADEYEKAANKWKAG